MPVQPVHLFGDPVLRAPAREVTDFGADLRTLVRDLWDTMEDRGGVGFAAPQLGIGLRVFVYHCDGYGGHLINPSVRVVDERQQLGPEGCLSIPGVAWDRWRYRQVVARGWNMHGEPVEVEGTELLARCVQHEVDHLGGVLFVDHLDGDARRRAFRRIQAASWFDDAGPTLKQSPHRLFGSD